MVCFLWYNEFGDRMKCDIRYVGKLRTGTSQYYCSTHKSFASDKNGKKLDSCLCEYKELFDNVWNLKENNIQSITIVYENILEKKVPKIIVNGKEFVGVFLYDTSILHYKDLGGMMLSRLNHIPLEIISCSHCNHYHSDNGKFAYTPHRTHLCLYCGHLFRVKERNIGNEFSMIYDIPDIKLENEKISVDEMCRVEYDLFSGKFLINGKAGNTIFYRGKEILLVEFLNELLENEF